MPRRRSKSKRRPKHRSKSPPKRRSKSPPKRRSKSRRKRRSKSRRKRRLRGGTVEAAERIYKALPTDLQERIAPRIRQQVNEATRAQIAQQQLDKMGERYYVPALRPNPMRTWTLLSREEKNEVLSQFMSLGYMRFADSYGQMFNAEELLTMWNEFPIPQKGFWIEQAVDTLVDNLTGEGL